MKEIPKTWLIAIVMIGLIVMRAFGIDSWTTATLGVIVGYLTGQHIQKAIQTPTIAPSTP